MRPFLFSVFVIFACAANARAAAELRFASGANRVSLLELYTSEGCSSCPPAERWLGTLRNAPGLWRDFVPVAFHVNYWDRLGWPDRFATREFTQREHAYAAKWNSNSVYTPCFVRDGHEWRPSSGAPAAAEEQAGVLSVIIREGARAEVEYSVPGTRRQNEEFEIHVAILGSGFQSKVTAGENRGETLRHEFVALALETHVLPVTQASRSARRELPLPQTKITDAPRRAVALWVTLRGDLIPLQAIGGWLEP